jgi:hypothetical protein
VAGEASRETYPEAWIGQRVNMIGDTPHAPPLHGVILRDVNAYGITCETHTTQALKFIPWTQIREISLSETQELQDRV